MTTSRIGLRASLVLLAGLLLDEGDARAQQDARAAADPIVQMVASPHTACLRRASGRVECWGTFFRGALGPGSPTVLAAPTVVAGVGPALDVSVSMSGGCAVQRDGQPICWGHGEVLPRAPAPPAPAAPPAAATSPFTLQITPPTPVADVSDAIDVGSGYSATCVVRRAGTVACWGMNPSITGRPDAALAPVAGVRDAVEVAVGTSFACARQRNGGVVCWGSNESGQLGDGATTSRSDARPVRGLRGARALAVASSSACAVLADRTVWCWGAGSAGQLGADVAPPGRSTAATVPGLARVVDLVALTAGYCARTDDGAVSCWGANDEGQLGTGPEPRTRTTPAAVPGVSGARSLGGGGMLACAPTATGVLCWGRHSVGAAVRVEGLGDVAELAAGDGFTCARQQSGGVVCWGANQHGQLGDGTFDARPRPTAVAGLDDAVAIAAAGRRVCAIRRVRDVVCWGSDVRGHPDAARPRRVQRLDRATSISVGRDEGCAVRDDGSLWCWSMEEHVYEPGDPLPRHEAERVDTAASIVEVALLSDTRAVRRRDGSVGALDGEPAIGLTDARRIAGGGGIVCAVRASGRLSCLRASSSHATFDVEGATDALAVDLEGSRACVVGRSGRVRCWGEGHLGGESEERVPVDEARVRHRRCRRGDRSHGDCTLMLGLRSAEVSGVSDAVGIALGAQHACVLHRAGGVSCWGNGAVGQLGDGVIATVASRYGGIRAE